VSRQHVSLAREFAIPVERLFAYFAEHENLARIFAPAKVKRLRDGPVERNGVGSARTVRPGPMPSFVETVTAYRENECIEYRITKGGPLRNHLGRMRFSVLGASASRFEIDIVFEGKFPGAGPIFRFILDRGISRGLADLERDAAFLGHPA
jgi:uncharacterized protein YndB with AHSA1/START domain